MQWCNVQLLRMVILVCAVVAGGPRTEQREAANASRSRALLAAFVAIGLGNATG